MIKSQMMTKLTQKKLILINILMKDFNVKAKFIEIKERIFNPETGLILMRHARLKMNLRRRILKNTNYKKLFQ